MDSSASGPSSVVATPRLDTGTHLAEPRTLLALMEKPDRKGRVENRKQERKVDQRRFKGEAEAQLLDLAAQKSKDQEEGRKTKREGEEGKERKRTWRKNLTRKRKRRRRERKKERKGPVDRRSAVKQRMERNRQGGELVVLELQPAGSATEEVRAGPRSSALKHMRSSGPGCISGHHPDEWNPGRSEDDELLQSSAEAVQLVSEQGHEGVVLAGICHRRVVRVA